MMPSKRDYKSEYRRRLERGLKRGLSRSQSRGHARAGEHSIREPTAKPASDPRLEQALKAMRKTGNQRQAAKASGISIERFRKFIREADLAKRQGRAWIIEDQRPRLMTTITIRGPKDLKVTGFDLTSLIGRHDNAVKRFLKTNDASLLLPFRGLSIRDVSGRTHFLETRPNALYRLAAQGNETFEMVYRLVQ
jgi:hypothetical protein